MEYRITFNLPSKGVQDTPSIEDIKRKLEEIGCSIRMVETER